MVQFFIHRPVFAWVLAIVVMLAGGYSLLGLPVSQYPDIAPTTIRISASYNGATAEAVQSSVTEVIEDGLTGIDGLLYTTASSRQGSASLTLIFDEIDRGVGGATADAVGRRLKALAAGGQVLVVTHSPQVAALGGAHWRVEKRVAGEVTLSTVTPLSPADRVEEVARMLAGDTVTDAAREAARALLSA